MKTPTFRNAIILIGCLLVTSGIGLGIFQYIKMDYQQETEAAIRLQMDELHDDMQLELRGISNALSFLVDQVESHSQGWGEESKRRLSQDFLSFIRTSNIYDQIRLIDLSGKEVIRVNYNDGKPELVMADALQDKSNRYYFQEGLKLNRGEVYVSPFDLNIEHGEIEQPIKPTIRLVEPAFDKTDRQIGMIVVNMLGAPLLARIARHSRLIPVDYISLLNQHGYWLSGPVKGDLWAFMYPERQDRSMATVNPEVWQQVRDHDQARVEVSDGIYQSNTFYPDRVFGREGLHVDSPGEQFWKLVAYYPNRLVAEALIDQFRLIVIASIGSGVALAIILLGMLRLRRQSELQHIVEERAHQQEMENARSKAIVTIAGGMAHEFNNILAGILGSTYLLRTGLDGQPELFKRIDTIESLGERAGELVQLLMTFAQVDYKEYRRLKLNDLVAAKAEEIQLSLPNRIRLDLSIADTPFFVVADQGKLEKMLQHLLSNAIDAVAATTEPFIELTLAEAEAEPDRIPEKGRRYACLTLTDNGCGIPPEHLPHIFDPFYTTKEPGAGTGLGLAMVHGVVHALHGEIEVTDNRGQGTIVRVYLPLEIMDGG